MKFILDTNVISELMRSEPHPGVFDWVTRQPRRNLWITSISQTEILFGIAMMPTGKRRSVLAKLAEALFAEDFAGRILSYTSEAAPHYAEIVMARRCAGHPIETFDALIAATARAEGAAVATRDTGGFDGCDIQLFNPWTG